MGSTRLKLCETSPAQDVSEVAEANGRERKYGVYQERSKTSTKYTYNRNQAYYKQRCHKLQNQGFRYPIFGLNATTSPPYAEGLPAQ